MKDAIQTNKLTMTAREEFNLILNSCSEPRIAYNLLMALANTSKAKQGKDIIDRRADILNKVNAALAMTNA